MGLILFMKIFSFQEKIFNNRLPSTGPSGPFIKGLRPLIVDVIEGLRPSIKY